MDANKKTESKQQILRVCQMEQRLDRVATALKQLDQALQAYADVQEDVKALEAYYSSDEWRGDFESDEAGELPADLKRGVLSEDGLWNLLTEIRSLNARLGQRDE